MGGTGVEFFIICVLRIRNKYEKFTANFWSPHLRNHHQRAGKSWRPSALQLPQKYLGRPTEAFQFGPAMAPTNKGLFTLRLWVKRTLDKLSSRGQGRSPLKYINYRLCISLERIICLLEESLGFHKYCGQVFLHQTNSWRQNSQKVPPYRHFGGCCLLPFSVKAEWTNFCSTPIKLLESLIHSTDGRSVKCP
jgi:hypothetical protein